MAQKPTDRSRTFAEQRRGGRYYAESVPRPNGTGFLGRFSAPGLEWDFAQEGGAPAVFDNPGAAELAAARALIGVLNIRSSRLAFEKNDRYRKLSATEFAELLADAGITPELFAHIMGTDPNRVRQWLEGTGDIPHPARVILELLKAADGNVDIAEKVTDAVATSRKGEER